MHLSLLAPAGFLDRDSRLDQGMKGRSPSKAKAANADLKKNTSKN
jgi:hypothetical protein